MASEKLFSEEKEIWVSYGRVRGLLAIKYNLGASTTDDERLRPSTEAGKKYHNNFRPEALSGYPHKVQAVSVALLVTDASGRVGRGGEGWMESYNATFRGDCSRFWAGVA